MDNGVQGTTSMTGYELLAQAVNDIKKPTTELTGDAIESIFDATAKNDEINYEKFKTAIFDEYGIEDSDINEGITKDLFNWFNAIADGDGTGDKTTITREEIENDYTEYYNDYINNQEDGVEEGAQEDAIKQEQQIIADELINAGVGGVQTALDVANSANLFKAAGFNGRSVEDGKIQQNEDGSYYVNVDAWDANEKGNIDCASRLVYNVYGVSMYSEEGQAIYNQLLEANPDLVSNGELSLHPNQTINLVTLQNEVEETQEAQTSEATEETQATEEAEATEEAQAAETAEEAEETEEADETSEEAVEENNSVETRAYASQGEIITQTIQDGKVTQEVVSSQYNGDVQAYRYYAYNEDGTTTITTYGRDNETQTSTKIVQQDGSYNIDLYDSNGNTTSHGEYDANGNITKVILNKYDGNNTLTETSETIIDTENGGVTKTQTDYTTNQKTTTIKGSDGQVTNMCTRDIQTDQIIQETKTGLNPNGEFIAIRYDYQTQTFVSYYPNKDGGGYESSDKIIASGNIFEGQAVGYYSQEDYQIVEEYQHQE